MNLLVLTSSSLRHRALIWQLSQIANVNAVIEDARPLEPMGIAQRIIRKEVERVERSCFALPDPWQPSGLIEFCGWQKLVPPEAWIDHADYIVVFGTSLITDPLWSRIERKAINLHAGWSPQYRGSHCNFWALYDGHPEYVGVTIQALDRFADAGGIWHQVGIPPIGDPFLYGMKALKFGIDVLMMQLQRGGIWPIPKAQDRSQLIRYSRHVDYTEDVAHEFLEKYQIPA